MNYFSLFSPLFAGFLLLVASDSTPVLRSLIPIETYAQLKSGDLIFRQGSDTASAVVLAGKTKSIYSHVGMIVIKNKAALVIHAVPAETKNEVGGVKLESVDLFTRSDRAVHVAIMRPQYNVGENAAKKALTYIGKPFDAAFNLQDDSALYCTELVARSYLPFNINLYKKLQIVRLPFFNGQFLLPQDIFEQTQLIKVWIG